MNKDAINIKCVNLTKAKIFEDHLIRSEKMSFFCCHFDLIKFHVVHKKLY